MNEGVQSRRVYIKEFKEETIGLILNRGMSVSQVSKDLSIGTETLYRWIRQYKSDSQNSFPDKGHKKPEEEEMRRLKRELADVKEERDILKKAISIFSKTKQWSLDLYKIIEKVSELERSVKN